MNTKQTKECKSKLHTGDRILPIETFTKDRHRKDGYSDTCKECTKKRKKIWLQRVYSGDAEVQSVDIMRQKHKQYTQSKRKERGLAYCLWVSARDRAKKNGREFTINVEDVIIPKVCPIFNIPLINENVIHKGTKERPDNYPTIDRINSDGGYTLDNIMVISWRANNLKNNATKEEMIKMGEFAKTLP